MSCCVLACVLWTEASHFVDVGSNHVDVHQQCFVSKQQRNVQTQLLHSAASLSHTHSLYSEKYQTQHNLITDPDNLTLVNAALFYHFLRHSTRERATSAEPLRGSNCVSGILSEFRGKSTEYACIIPFSRCSLFTHTSADETRLLLTLVFCFWYRKL